MKKERVLLALPAAISCARRRCWPPNSSPQSCKFYKDPHHRSATFWLWHKNQVCINRARHDQGDPAATTPVPLTRPKGNGPTLSFSNTAVCAVRRSDSKKLPATALRGGGLRHVRPSSAHRIDTSMPQRLSTHTLAKSRAGVPYSVCDIIVHITHITQPQLLEGRTICQTRSTSYTSCSEYSSTTSPVHPLPIVLTRTIIMNHHVITVGEDLPVNSSSLDILRPMSTKGLRTSAVMSPCLDGSGSYFSMYMRTVAPTDPGWRVGAERFEKTVFCYGLR